MSKKKENEEVRIFPEKDITKEKDWGVRETKAKNIDVFK